jgi:hypothetical protein
MVWVPEQDARGHVNYQQIKLGNIQEYRIFGGEHKFLAMISPFGQ